MIMIGMDPEDAQGYDMDICTTALLQLLSLLPRIW